MDNFKIIYKILSTLEKSMDLEQCNSDYQAGSLENI